MKFKPHRLDGRSMTEVILDLIKGAEPETVFEYEEIIRALNAGASKEYSKKDAQSAMQRAKGRLSKEYQRMVRSIPNQGYKIAAANEHREIALSHKAKSEHQMKVGVQILRNVKWNEMDPESKRAHEGTLVIVSALYEQQAWLDRRLKKVETLISQIGGPPQ